LGLSDIEFRPDGPCWGVRIPQGVREDEIVGPQELAFVALPLVTAFEAIQHLRHYRGTDKFRCSKRLYTVRSAGGAGADGDRVRPAVRMALGDSRLRSAARQVRAELAKTRLRAMQSGIARRFRYQLGENRFETAPAGFDAEAEAAGSYADHADRRQTADRNRGDSIETETSDPASRVVMLELPEGVSFEPADQDLESTDDDDEEGWSSPIVFYPNGRAADAKIRLRGERNAVVDVSLRGLTGVATAGRPRHEKETE